MLVVLRVVQNRQYLCGNDPPYENGSRACLRMTMHSASVDGIEVCPLAPPHLICMSTSLMTTRTPLELYRRPMPRVLRGS
jgi:hypothetical protein